ncbi:hypothetical protein SLE2022_162010 [Rubroshorea leprosula]
MVLFVIILAVGTPFHRYRKPIAIGSPFTRLFRVIVVAGMAVGMNHFEGVEIIHEADLYEGDTTESDISGARKIAHTISTNSWIKAAGRTESIDLATNMKKRWRPCTVTQVEEFKCFLRILPIWASKITPPSHSPNSPPPSSAKPLL